MRTPETSGSGSGSGAEAVDMVEEIGYAEAVVVEEVGGCWR